MRFSLCPPRSRGYLAASKYIHMYLSNSARPYAARRLPLQFQEFQATLFVDRSRSVGDRFFGIYGKFEGAQMVAIHMQYVYDTEIDLIAS